MKNITKKEFLSKTRINKDLIQSLINKLNGFTNFKNTNTIYIEQQAIEGFKTLDDFVCFYNENGEAIKDIMIKLDEQNLDISAKEDIKYESIIAIDYILTDYHLMCPFFEVQR